MFSIVNIINVTKVQSMTSIRVNWTVVTAQLQWSSHNRIPSIFQFLESLFGVQQIAGVIYIHYHLGLVGCWISKYLCWMMWSEYVNIVTSCGRADLDLASPDPHQGCLRDHQTWSLDYINSHFSRNVFLCERNEMIFVQYQIYNHLWGTSKAMQC